MASPSLAARAAILGVPYQAGKRPDPLGVVKAFEALDAKAMATSAGAIVRDTLADLNAVTSPPAHQMGWVTSDATAENNGIYENAGSPSAPDWQHRADLPHGTIHMINVGAGTPDAIVATSSLPPPLAPGAALFTINIVADNTGPVTINGKPLRTNSGNEIVPGGITAGSIHAFLDLGDHYRLLSDQASAAIIAAAENWAIQAGNLADDADNAADRAEGFAAMLSSDKVKFKTVPLLLSDTLMSYDDEPGKIHVGPGDIITAQGFRYEVAASGAVDAHIETAGGVKLRVLPSNGKYVWAAWGVSSAMADVASLFNLAAEVAATAGLPLDIGGSEDVFQVTSAINPDVAGKTLHLIGTPTFNVHSGGSFLVSGSITEVTSISAAAGKGELTVTVADATGIAVGDMIAIEDDTDYSFSATQNRTYYHAGDFTEIVSIDGNDLTLMTPIHENYSGALTDKVFKVAPVQLVTDEFKIVEDTTTAYAARVVLGRKCRINFSAEGGSNYATHLDRLWQSGGDRGTHINRSAINTTNYGVLIGNSQDCVFNFDYLYGTRRGVAVGGAAIPGAVPNRNVIIQGGVSDSTGEFASADFHGNCDDCRFINHKANFFQIGGRSSKVIDCSTTPGTRAAIEWTELAGGDVEVRNLQVMRGEGATFPQLVRWATSTQSAEVNEDISLNINGIKVDNGDGLTWAVNAFFNFHAGVRYSLFVDGIDIRRGTVDPGFRLVSSVRQAPADPAVAIIIGENSQWPMVSGHEWLVQVGTPATRTVQPAAI